MDQGLVQQFLIQNGTCFRPEQLSEIKKKLEEMDDSKEPLILSLNLQKPNLILIIAIVFGWDRLFLGDIGLGILKVLTCYGVFVWWLIDIFTAKKRTYDYNYKKFNQAVMN